MTQSTGWARQRKIEGEEKGRGGQRAGGEGSKDAGAGEHEVIRISTLRAKGCGKPCTKRALVPIQIPSPHCRALLLLPVTPVWMQRPAHHHTEPLIGRESSPAQHPQSFPRDTGWGRQDRLHKDRRTRGFFLLEQRNGSFLSSSNCCPAPKTAYHRAASG